MTVLIYRVDIPYLSSEQMIEVDRVMIEDFGIELVQMMENAGRALAHLARARFLGGDPLDKQVTVMAGTGATAAVRWCVRDGCTSGVRWSRPSSPNLTKTSLRFLPISSGSYAGWRWGLGHPKLSFGDRSPIWSLMGSSATA